MNLHHETPKTEMASRIIRAGIGFSLTVPVVANIGLGAWATFGLSFIGACMVFNAMLGKHFAESVLTCGTSFVVAVMMVFNADLATPVSIAALSFASIAAVTVALISYETATGKVKSVNAGVRQVAQEQQAANEAGRAAA